MYYFDVLPIHPAPKPFESWTGYLARLAKANLYTHPCELDNLLGKPNGSRFFKRLDDFPPHNLRKIAPITAQSFETLLATTLFPAAANLGRCATRHSMSMFLKGSISETLRYCPECLKEDLYIRLPWRFISLEICPIHQRRILDACPNCKKSLPLIAKGFNIHLCPSCKHSLLDVSQNEIFTLEEIAKNTVMLERLKTLLTLKVMEDGIKGQGKKLGAQIRQVRYSKGTSISDICIERNLPHSALFSVELSVDDAGKGTFLHLMEYLDSLGIALEDLLHDRIASEQQRFPNHALTGQGAGSYIMKIKKHSRAMQRVENRVERVREEIAALRASGEPITRENICRRIGIQGLSTHGDPQMIALVKEIQIARAEQLKEQLREEEKDYLAKAKQVINEILPKYGFLNVREFYFRMGVDRSTLEKFPRIQELLKFHAANKQVRYRNLTPEKLATTIETQKRDTGNVTQLSLAEQLSVSTAYLMKKPDLREVMERYSLVQKSHHLLTFNGLFA